MLFTETVQTAGAACPQRKTAMSTCCSPVPFVMPLPRPWWQRLVDDLRPRRRPPPLSAPAQWRAADWRSVSHLGRGTLRDIGAPEWVADVVDLSRRRDDALWR